jgi:ferredoxin-NADP reductase
MADASSTRVKVSVLAAQSVTSDVVELTLASADGTPLPTWEAGAHIDLELPSGLVRQYSLCGALGAATYTVAVLREPNGRGGSVEVHEALTVGTMLMIAGPRNNFSLNKSRSYLFIAGGIGITPLLPMIEEAQRASADWSLVYGGRSRSSMAYLDRLTASGGDHVRVIPEDTDGRPNLPELLGSITPDTEIYCCGPGGLLDAVDLQSSELGLSERLHTERFAAAADAITGPVDGDTAFDVELEQSGITVRVEADQTILDALDAAGVDAPFSCEEGFCGSCETRVVCGTPLHRDTVASADAHDAASTMIICVGRSRGPRLVLDL